MNTQTTSPLTAISTTVAGFVLAGYGVFFLVSAVLGL